MSFFVPVHFSKSDSLPQISVAQLRVKRNRLIEVVESQIDASTELGREVVVSDSAAQIRRR